MNLWCKAIQGRKFQVSIEVCENRCKSKDGKENCKTYLEYKKTLSRPKPKLKLREKDL